MMRKLIVLFVSVFFSILFWGKKSLKAENLYSADKGLTTPQIDSLKKYLKFFPDNTQISIALVNGDKVTFAGVRKEKDSLVYTENKDSIFEIGSVTKVFTSVLLSKFVNEGSVKLDEPIKDFFDFPLKQSSLSGKEITLENLANHTSGLPRIDMAMLSGTPNIKNPYKDYDEGKLKDYLRNRMKLDTVPGTKFSYSNLGGGLLAYILCKKFNKTYEELLQENIFGPFNMTSSTTDLSRIKSGLIKGLTTLGSTAENWDFTNATAGGGAIKSTSVDMARFIQAHFSDNKVLQLPLQKTFSIKENTDIGLAWLITQKGNRTIYWHNGGTGGYRSCIAIDLANKKGICLLSNVSAFHPKSDAIDKLSFLLLESIN